jgi:hypothetical protein
MIADYVPAPSCAIYGSCLTLSTKPAETLICQTTPLLLHNLGVILTKR